MCQAIPQQSQRRLTLDWWTATLTCKWRRKLSRSSGSTLEAPRSLAPLLRQNTVIEKARRRARWRRLCWIVVEYENLLCCSTNKLTVHQSMSDAYGESRGRQPHPFMVYSRRLHLCIRKRFCHNNVKLIYKLVSVTKVDACYVGWNIHKPECRI